MPAEDVSSLTGSSARITALHQKQKTVAWPAFHIQRLLQALFSMNKVIEGFQSVILHHAEKPNNEGTFIRHLERSWSNKHFLYPLSARAELGAQGEDAEWELRNMKMNEGPADGEEQASVCEGGGGAYMFAFVCVSLYIWIWIICVGGMWLCAHTHTDPRGTIFAFLTRLLHYVTSASLWGSGWCFKSFHELFTLRGLSWCFVLWMSSCVFVFFLFPLCVCSIIDAVAAVTEGFLSF